MVKRMVWTDTELMVLLQVTDELWKLREQPEAQIRVLRYVTERLGLPVLVMNARPLVPDVERCEEIGSDIYFG